MFKVFINENELVILNENEMGKYDCMKRVTYDGKDSLSKVIIQLEAKTAIPISICLYGKDPKVIWKDFCSRYKLIEAAGGLVKNEKDEMLFIFRRGKWDLPKGKLEKGESIEECGMREVEEECGIRKLKIINPLPSTYHTYILNGKSVLKRSYWFEMTAPGNQVLTPQLEEDITEIRWVNKSEMATVLKNSFSSIREVIANMESIN